MKQTVKLGCRVLIALLCLAVLASVITVPAFAAEGTSVSDLQSDDLRVFMDLLNKYNSVKDDDDAAEQLKDYVEDKYYSDATFKESADSLLGGAQGDKALENMDLVIDDVLMDDTYTGGVDVVVDALMNGATFEEVKESIQYQKDNPDSTKTCTVVWMVEGIKIDEQQIPYMKLIPAHSATTSAGEYVNWNNEYLIAKKDHIVITGTTVNIVEAIVADVNDLPVNYNEYEMTYANGVATLTINVTASDYDDILRDILGDVRASGTKSAYKSAVTAFLKSTAQHVYNSKANTVAVNGHEVVGIEGYGVSELADLVADVQAGNYGKIFSAPGIKQALLSNPVTPSDIIEMGDDGVITSYDITLGAEGKEDFDFELQIALDGNLDLIRKAAKTVMSAFDYAMDTNGDLHVEIFVPAAFTSMLTEALNDASVSEETKKTIVEGLAECATVGEMIELFDLLTFDQYVTVVERLLEDASVATDKEQALIEKIESLRPVFELTEKYGDILIEKLPESVTGAQASVTVRAIYNLMKLVSYEDLAALTQYKDVDGLAYNARLNEVVTRVANRYSVSPARAQDIVERMIEEFGKFQDRIPDSAKAQSAYEAAERVIDLVFNKIPDELKDVSITDTYEGEGEFSYAFSTTYNPGAWLKNVLDKIDITVYGRTIVLGDYVPTRDITSDISFNIHVADLYAITYVDENGNVLFEGFLPYDAEIVLYGTDLSKDGHDFMWVDEEGNELTTMPGKDTVAYAKYIAHEYTITFVDEDGTVLYSDTFAHGTIPTYVGDTPVKGSTNTAHYTFKGWMDADGNVYEGALPEALCDATYTAVYAETDRTYTITFDILGNLVSKEYAYGEIPSYDATLTNLDFKGWKDYGMTLPAVTGNATYKAEYTATIKFYVEGVLYKEMVVDYGTKPTVTDPSKVLDYQYRYAFAGWSNRATGRGVTAATAHAVYDATFSKTAHNVVLIPNPLGGYNLPMGGYQEIGQRLTASSSISVLLELAAVDESFFVTAVVTGDDRPGAHDVTIVLDNAALRNILANATEEDVDLTVSVLLGQEYGWPSGVASYYDYDVIFSFDLVGSALNGGNATVTVPFEKDSSRYHATIDYVGDSVETMLDKVKNQDTLTFTTSHFSYYAVSYVQHVFTVNFYDVNSTLVNTYDFDVDLGQTLTLADVPAFSALPESDANGHYISFWKYGNRNFVDPVTQFANHNDDYDFYEVQRQVAHNYGAYECTDTHHSRTCADCGYVEGPNEHVFDQYGNCICGQKLPGGGEDTDTSDTEPNPDTSDTEPDTGTTEPDTDTTEPDTGTTEPDTDTTEPDPGTTEPDPGTTEPDPGTTEPDPGTTEPDPGTTEPDPGTTEPDAGTTEPDSGTTEPDPGTTEVDPGSSDTDPGEGSETETDTTPVGGPDNKNGWWIFLIILLVFIAILIIAYILYAHNIFPKGPAEEEEPASEPEVVEEKVEEDPAPVAPVEEIHIVEHVDAKEADTLMTDAQAVNYVELIASTATGKMDAVNVGTLNVHYEAGDKVDILSLKEKKLVSNDCKRVKILADGDLDKALIVEANGFSLQAIKMITLTGGHAIKLQPIAPDAKGAPAEKTAPVEETPVEETPVEETPVEETPVEETPVEETPVEEAPVEEAPVEETPAQETDAE